MMTAEPSYRRIGSTMLNRKIARSLKAWRTQPHRKALLVTGARQIGKSCFLRELGRTRHRASFEVNLLENPVARRALAEARDVRDFISRITVMAPDRLPPGETLIFIDEIQELPDVMTWAKFLVEDGRYDWAFSGSMLGTEFKGVRSYPVRYVHELQMFPMDFEEFCWALNLSSEAFDVIRDACERKEPVPPYLHDTMLANFRTYLVVGGMPEVVQRFLDTRGDLGAVRELQTEFNRQVPARHLQIRRAAGSPGSEHLRPTARSAQGRLAAIRAPTRSIPRRGSRSARRSSPQVWVWVVCSFKALDMAGGSPLHGLCSPAPWRGASIQKTSDPPLDPSQYDGPILVAARRGSGDRPVVIGPTAHTVQEECHSGERECYCTV